MDDERQPAGGTRALEARILGLSQDGKLPPERQLAEQLGVNRYALRKALGALRDKREIPSSRPRNAGRARGRQKIAELTSPAEVWEVRLLIEPEIARLAAVRGTPAEIEAILAAHAMAEPGVFDLEHDIAFHSAVAAAGHNALAQHLLAQILALTRDEAFRTRLPAYTDETGWRHHDQIAAAIRDRHAAEAERVMRTHLSAILAWLNGGSAAPDREDI